MNMKSSIISIFILMLFVLLNTSAIAYSPNHFSLWQWNPVGDDWAYPTYNALGLSNGTVYLATNADIRQSDSTHEQWTQASWFRESQTVLSLMETTEGAVYAGTWTETTTPARVHRTTNYGEYWVECQAIPDAIAVNKLVEIPDGSIFAAVEQENQDATYGAVYRSSNKCEEWQSTAALPDGLMATHMAASTDGFLYIGGECQAGTACVYVSSNRGDSWTPTSTINSQLPLVLLEPGRDGSIYLSTGVNGVFQQLTPPQTQWQDVTIPDGILGVTAFHETKDNWIWLGTVTEDEEYIDNRVYYYSPYAGIWRPTGPMDLPGTIQQIIETSSGELRLLIQSEEYQLMQLLDGCRILEGTFDRGFNRGEVNPDNACEICDPDRSSIDWTNNHRAGCLQWIDTELIDEQDQVNAIGVNTDGTYLAGAYSGSGSFHYANLYRSTDEGETWTRTAESAQLMDMHSILATSDGVFFVTGSCLYEDEERQCLLRSTDSGETWDVQIDPATIDGRVGAIMESSGGTLVLGGAHWDQGSDKTVLATSTDGGLTWDVGPWFGSYWHVRALAEGTDGLWHAGTDAGWYFVSDDNGQSWEIYDYFGYGFTIWYLAPSDAGRIYLTSNKQFKFYYTYDGTSFINGGEIDRVGDPIALLTDAGGTIWSGTDVETPNYAEPSAHIFYSLDDGLTWLPTGRLMGTIWGARSILSLADTLDGTILAGGEGRCPHCGSGTVFKSCNGCVMEGTCYEDGEVNPENSTQYCNTNQHTNAWSYNSAGCRIGDVLYSQAERNPENPCQICDPSYSSIEWKFDNGASCDDGNPCTENDTCMDYKCVGDLQQCDDGLWCTGYETCDPATGDCFSRGNPCSESQDCMEEYQVCVLPFENYNQMDRGNAGSNVAGEDSTGDDDDDDIYEYGPQIRLYSTSNSRLGQSTHIGEFDGSGGVDLIVADSKYNQYESGAVLVYFDVNQIPSGEYDTESFPPDVLFQGQEEDELGYQMTVCDFNGDGIQDIILTHDSNGGSFNILLVFYGGDHWLSGTVITELIEDADVVIWPNEQNRFRFAVNSCADITGDGMDDLLAGRYPVLVPGGDYESGSLLDLHWTAPPVQFTEYYQSNSSGDLNGDGRLDFIMNKEKSLDVWFGFEEYSSYRKFTEENPVQDFVVPAISPYSTGIEARGVGDWNGDNVDDLLVYAYFSEPYSGYDGYFFVVKGAQGMQPGAEPVKYFITWNDDASSKVLFADANGDDFVDLLLKRDYSLHFYWDHSVFPENGDWWNLSAHTPQARYETYVEPVFGDLDNDDHPDIVFPYPSHQEVEIWFSSRENGDDDDDTGDDDTGDDDTGDDDTGDDDTGDDDTGDDDTGDDDTGDDDTGDDDTGDDDTGDDDTGDDDTGDDDTGDDDTGDDDTGDDDTGDDDSDESDSGDDDDDGLCG